MTESADSLTLIECGEPPEKCEHDFTGPMRTIDTGLGVITEATCRKCGRGAFNMWDIW